MLSHLSMLEVGSLSQPLRTSAGCYAKAYLSSIAYFSYILWEMKLPKSNGQP